MLLVYLGAFGEGRAMLAAAGSPTINPHAADDDTIQTRWNRDVAHAPADIDGLSRFSLRCSTGASLPVVCESSLCDSGEQACTDCACLLPWNPVTVVPVALLNPILSQNAAAVVGYRPTLGATTKYCCVVRRGFFSDQHWQRFASHRCGGLPEASRAWTNQRSVSPCIRWLAALRSPLPHIELREYRASTQSPRS
jgi:hypothetical protein